MDTAEQNLWKKLSYEDPAAVTTQLWMFETMSQMTSASDQIKDWRRKPLQKWVFRKQGALFCYALSTRYPEEKWGFAMIDDTRSEFDAVFCRVGNDDNRRYEPVQLKEVVPPNVNEQASLDSVLHKLKKYSNPKLLVGIYLKQVVTIPPENFTTPSLNLKELWVYGLTPQVGVLWGDLLHVPAMSTFRFPPMHPNDLWSNGKRSTVT